jgi:hypothetical protein
VPFIPVVELTTPFVFASEPMEAVELQPVGLVLEQFVNESALSFPVTGTPVVPPALVVVTPTVDEVHVNVGLAAPPDVVRTAVVDGARCAVITVSLGRIFAHGVVFVLHRRVAEAVVAPTKATREKAAITAIPRTLR